MPLSCVLSDGSGNEEPIERVVKQSHQRSPDLYSPAPRTSSSRPSLFTGEGIENDDSGFGEFPQDSTPCAFHPPSNHVHLL